MTTTMIKPAPYDLFHPDRPGWIPDTVGDDWDPHPYAYQTREELMPAGYFHGLYIQVLAELLRPVLVRNGIRLCIDVFIFYRDWEGRKQRIAPDALLAPPSTQPENDSPHKYDLDLEPVPLCAIEIISPKSRKVDRTAKRKFYALMGIQEYLLLDVEDEYEQTLPQIEITLWRVIGGEQHQVLPDSEGFLTITSAGVRLRADGRTLVAQDLATGARLHSAPELTAALTSTQQTLASTQQILASTQQALELAEQRAQAEAEARQQAEAELQQLREQLAHLQNPTND